MIAQPAGSPKFLIVMTAAITPSPGVKVQRSDPRIRREDYRRALLFWLNHPDPRLGHILFLENSGADLSFLRELAENQNTLSKQVEFISTASHELPFGLHYGWCELKMLDEGLVESSLRRRTTHMIKVTGRFTFPRISKLLDYVAPVCDAMVDCRVPTRSYRKGRKIVSALLNKTEAYASTQLAIFSHCFYREHIYDLASAMKPFRYPYDLMENAIYERLRQLGPSKAIHMRFPCNCDPSGIGAKGEQDYDTLARRLTSTARGALRWTGLWF